MFGTILIVFSLVVLTLLSVVTLNLASLALARAGKIRNLSQISFLIQDGFIVLGLFGLWKAMGLFFGQGELTEPLAQSLKLSAIFLYLAGAVVYVELQSLVSRGYSLRILVDLLNNGGKGSIESLKAGYGDGSGVRGMLAKRLRTLASLGLVRLRGDRIGPLTRLGKVFALASSWMRQFLRLELVG